MNRANDIVKTALNYATSVLFELDDAGVVVHNVHIEGGMPTITVDRAPPTGRPAIAVTRTIGGQRVTRNTAFIRGCRIEWQSSEPRRATA